MFGGLIGRVGRIRQIAQIGGVVPHIERCPACPTPPTGPSWGLRPTIVATLFTAILLTIAACRPAAAPLPTSETIVWENAVTRDDWSRIAAAAHIRRIELQRGSEEPLYRWPPLPRLKSLIIRGQAVDPIELATLIHKYPQLRLLNIPHIERISSESGERGEDYRGKGGSDLSQAKHLDSLRLGGAAIDGRLIRAIADIPNLRHLHLIQPTMTDEDLAVVAGIESLRSFYLDDCELSPEAWKLFFEARPNIHVHLDQAHSDYDPGKH